MEIVEPPEVLEPQARQARIASQVPQPGCALVPVHLDEPEPWQVPERAQVRDPRALIQVDSPELRAVPADQYFKGGLIQPGDAESQRVRMIVKDRESRFARTGGTGFRQVHEQKPRRNAEVGRAQILQGDGLRGHLFEPVVDDH